MSALTEQFPWKKERGKEIQNLLPGEREKKKIQENTKREQSYIFAVFCYKFGSWFYSEKKCNKAY